MGQRFLGSDERQRFRVRIEVDGKASLEVRNARFPKRREALLVPVLAHGRVVHRELHGGDGLGRRGPIVIARAQVDHVPALFDHAAFDARQVGQRVSGEGLESIGEVGHILS